ncbi:MAG: redox-sensing transcriptional repressor Rex, partial [Planctomycetes bacterium]|nr:redox-sensing transcriptional repressor Rex [Planctomycetota bacterium]
IITVPSSSAQQIADLFIEGGIDRIWSFAPQILTVPEHVTVQREDLYAGLAELLVRSNANISSRRIKTARSE